MKQAILAILVILITISLNAQLLVGIGVGYSTEKKTPAAQFDFGLAIQKTTISVGYITHISQKADAGALFSLKLGRVFSLTETIALHPSFGYGIMYVSADKTDLNLSGATAGLELLKKIGYSGNMAYLGSYVGMGYVFVSVGVKIGLFKEQYCK
jgi:hypothetical protein